MCNISYRSVDGTDRLELAIAVSSNTVAALNNVSVPRRLRYFGRPFGRPNLSVADQDLSSGFSCLFNYA